MRPRNRKRQQLGQFWLWQRPGVGTWHICWLERVDGRSVTRRKSVAAAGGHADAPPQEALDALAAHHIAHTRPTKQAKDEALVEALMAEWLKHHVANLAAPARYIYSVDQWIAFFDRERRAGRLRSGPTVADLIAAHRSRNKRAFRDAAGPTGATSKRWTDRDDVD